MPIHKYNGTPIAQIDYDLSLSFSTPMALCVEEYYGDLVRISGHRYRMNTTPDSPVIAYLADINEENTWKEMVAGAINNSESTAENNSNRTVDLISLPFSNSTKGVAMSDDELIVSTAISFMSIPKEESEKNYSIRGFSSYTFGRVYLSAARLGLSNRSKRWPLRISKEGMTSKIRTTMPFDFLCQLSSRQLDIVLATLCLPVVNKMATHLMVLTKNILILEKIQYMATLACRQSYRGGLMIRDMGGTPQDDGIKLYFEGAEPSDIVRVKTVSNELYGGMLYSLSTCAGMSIVRQEGCLAIISAK